MTDSPSDHDPPTPEGPIEPFLAHLAHERRLATLTISNYRRDLERIAAWRGYLKNLRIDNGKEFISPLDLR